MQTNGQAPEGQEVRGVFGGRKRESAGRFVAAGERVDDEEKRRHELMRGRTGAECLGNGSRRDSVNRVKPRLNMESCLRCPERMRCRVSKGGRGCASENSILLKVVEFLFKMN